MTRRYNFDVKILYTNGSETMSINGHLDGAAAVVEAMQVVRRKSKKTGVCCEVVGITVCRIPDEVEQQS